MTPGVRRAVAVVLVAALALITALALVGPADAVPEKLVLRDLDRGAGPAEPFVVGETLFDGDLRIELPSEVGQYLGRSGTDYVLQGFDRRARKEAVYRVGPTGVASAIVRAEALSDAELSPDGTSFTASRYFYSGEQHTVLRRYDTTTGAVTASTQVQGYASVLDDDGTIVLISGEKVGTSTWQPGTGAVSRLIGQRAYAADLVHNRLVRFTRDPYLGGCTVVSSISRPRQAIWRSCDDTVLAVSADGSRIATSYILGDGLGPGRISLRSASGRLLGTYDAPYVFQNVSFEDDSSLMLEAYSKRSVAGVRCDGSTCERATPTVRHGQHFRPGFVVVPGR